MKKLVFIVAIAVFSLQSCNAGQSENKSNEKSATSALVETVSQSSDEITGSVKLTKEKFLKEVWDYETNPKEWVFKGEKPVLIDFYADWCGPCKIASPILDEVAKEYADKIIVYKVDTEVEKELAGIFQIRGIPAFFYIPLEGNPIPTSGIARSKEQTKQMFIDNIEKYLLTSN
jgi:thioredoxin 1